MSGLTKSEIMKVVNRYIGVSGGYLGDFSYRTHAEFYQEYCDLDIDPSRLGGTTRERFIHILETHEPAVQARILRGVLGRFPVGPLNAPGTRTQALHDELLAIIGRLECSLPIANPSPRITSQVVQRAISDAETLLKTTGASSAVDRVHTALHGYLMAVCDTEAITYQDDASLTVVFKALRTAHPLFQPHGARAGDITQVLRALASILDALNPVRNKASVAHPNQELLDKPEATLVINAARTILHYLDEKLAPVPNPASAER